jgi:hypothetical protein
MRRVTGIGGTFWMQRGPVASSSSEMQLHLDDRSRRNNGKPPFSARTRRPAERTMRPIVLIAALCAAGSAAAEEWPALRHGMWEFNRSIETVGKGGKPQTVQSRNCVSPTEDMKRQNETLSKAGCKFSPLARTGNVYTYSAVCKMQGMSGTSKSVLTVDGDGAYAIRVESDFGGEATRELMQARRTGDCR